MRWNLDSLVSHFPSAITKNGSIYSMTDSLEVSAGDSLMVNPGATWLLDSAAMVSIYGHLLVDGGGADSIISISAIDSANYFEGFRFEEFSSGRFLYANVSYGGGIRVLTEDFVMSYSSVSHQVARASTGAAVNFSRGNPVVMYSTFEYNEMPAFASGANQEVAPVIMHNLIRFNTQGNSNRPQINLGPSGSGDTTKIIGNSIIGDRSKDKVGGISVSSLLSVPLNAVIDSNNVFHNRYGITMAGANIQGFIRANNIDSNNTQNIPMQGGSGISLNSSGGPLEVVASYNAISNNLWGITLIGKASINLGDTTLTSYNEGKNIFSANGNGGNIYALYNNTNLPVQAINNCWEEDTTSGLSAEDVIFHENDDASLGKVTYNPVWDCMESSVGLEVQKHVEVELYPNPANGVLNVELQEPARLEIISLSGSLMLHRKLDAGLQKLDVNLPAGVYLVRVRTEASSFTQKLVIR